MKYVIVKYVIYIFFLSVCFEPLLHGRLVCVVPGNGPLQVKPFNDSLKLRMSMRQKKLKICFSRDKLTVVIPASSMHTLKGLRIAKMKIYIF